MGIITQSILGKKKFLGRLTEQTLGTELGILDEMTFLDPAVIEVTIRHLQDKHKSIREQLLQYPNGVEQKEQLEVLEELMAFYASNSFSDLGWCEKLLQDKKTPFIECVLALQDYQAGDKERAFIKFVNYFSQHPKPVHHFLINKTFGELLDDKGYKEKSIAYLKLALQTRPEDEQCYQMLIKIYKEIGQLDKAQRLEECLIMIKGERK